METTVSVSSSADLARRVAQAADILAELPPSLPALAAVSVHEGGRVDLYPDWPDRERNVLKWAITLNGTAMLDMSNSGYLVVVVPFGGGEARIESYLPQRRAYELGALLQTPVTPGGQVQVDPAALLAALDAEAAGKRVSS